MDAIKIILNNHGKPMASIQGTTRYYGISPFNTFYPQDEVDATIAEKDDTIDELKERNDELQKATDSAWSKVNAMYDEIRRQKYKRCLAMAKWCFTKSNYHFVLARHGEDAQENNRRSVLYSKWHTRWLAIAEKFKPN